MGARQQAALEALAERAARRCRLGSPHRLRALDPAQPRAARADARSRTPPMRRAPARGRGSGRGRGACALTADQQAAFALIESRLAPGDAVRTRLARCSFTGSRAAARPRSTCARWPPRSSAATRRSCSSRRSRSRRRPPAASSSASATTVAVMHSRLSQRERYDEWWRMRARRGARVRGPALGGVRAVRRPRPDHRRRGARRLVQAGGRSALRRARGRRAPRRRGGRPARGRAAPRRGRRACCATSGSCCPRAWTGGGCRRWSSWGWRAPPARSTSARARRSTTSAAASEKAIVLLNRRGWSNFLSCRSCGRVWECPNCDVTLVLHRALDEVACHHCGHREVGAAGLPRLRVRVGGAPRGGHRAARARARGAGGAAAGVPARLRRGRCGRGGHGAARASTRRRRACWWAPRWWRRATTSRT